MADVGALSAGLQGIQRGLADAQSAAQRIANPQLEDGVEDLAVAAVDLLRAEIQVKASAAVVKTVDATIGSLIDEFS